MIQSTLDSCLLTDEEFEMGSDGWRAVMGDVFLGDTEAERGGDVDSGNSSDM